MKWTHEVKWNKKLKRKQHTYRALAWDGSPSATVKITHIIGIPTEWRHFQHGGTCASVEEAKGLIVACRVLERMTA